jgi:hypothetical protein
MKKDNIPYDEKLDFGSGCEKKKYEWIRSEKNRGR